MKDMATPKISRLDYILIAIVFVILIASMIWGN